MKNTAATIIAPRKCPHCGSTSYYGILGSHLAARHPAFATPMRPWSPRVARLTGR